MFRCSFNDADWTEVNFSGVKFGGAYTRNIKNAHKAIGLDSIPATSGTKFFDTAKRPWWNVWLDWERIGLIGRLPLFAASTTALVFLPIYFYVLDVYNSHIVALKAVLEGHLGKEAALEKIGKLPIPDLSLEVFISVVLLFIASLLYGVFCPPRIKEFSREQWCLGLDKSLITY